MPSGGDGRLRALRLAALELVAAARAVDLNGRSDQLGRDTATVYAALRRRVPFTDAGHDVDAGLTRVVDWLEQGGA